MTARSSLGACLVAVTLGLATGAAAEDASGTITGTMDNTPTVWTVLAGAPASLADSDTGSQMTGFTPQGGELAGLDALVIWAQATPDGAPMVLAAYHRASGDPGPADAYLGGALFLFEGTQGDAWVADPEAGDIVIDSYSVSGSLAAARGHFSVTAFFEAADADEPDTSRTMEIAGDFDVQLPRLETQ